LRGSLLYNNTNAANPFRLDRAQAVTCDNNHGYTNEQKAYNGGLLDKFVQFTGSTFRGCNPKQVMGYYDGNTVTAIWNYAQHYAMNDNFYGTTFGPSTPGHINLISGQTHGAVPANVKLYGTTFGPSNVKLPSTYRYDAVINGTLIANVDPKFDDCSDNTAILMKGKNIGDLLNAKGITWGWFAGGLDYRIRVPMLKSAVTID
jgi:phospholipase C